MKHSFEWWRDDDGEVLAEHAERLEEHAQNRIAEMQKEGYVEGELLEELQDSSDNTIAYSGWWRIEK